MTTRSFSFSCLAWPASVSIAIFLPRPPPDIRCWNNARWFAYTGENSLSREVPRFARRRVSCYHPRFSALLCSVSRRCWLFLELCYVSFSALFLLLVGSLPRGGLFTLLAALRGCAAVPLMLPRTFVYPQIRNRRSALQWLVSFLAWFFVFWMLGGERGAVCVVPFAFARCTRGFGLFCARRGTYCGSRVSLDCSPGGWRAAVYGRCGMHGEESTRLL